MTDEQAAECWQFREQLGGLLVEAFKLVCDTHPEAIRAILARAFECSAIEESQDRMVSILTRTQELANEQRLRLNERDQQIETQERRTDAIEVRLDKGAKALTQLARLFEQLKRTGYVGPINRNGVKR